MPVILDAKNDNEYIQGLIKKAKVRYNKTGNKAVVRALEDAVLNMPHLRGKLKETEAELYELKDRYDTLINALNTIKLAL